MSRRICLVLAASLALAGCDMTNRQDTQYDDSRNPYYKQAEQDLDNNNPASALSDYESALAANPKLVEAHYQMGIICGDKMGDPISAIYHLKRYLELAPNSDKADQVKAMIDKQSTAFAAALPNSPTQSADDYARLQSDNASLKKQVDDATRTIAQLQGQLTQADQTIKEQQQQIVTTAASPTAVTASNVPPGAPVVTNASAASTNVVAAVSPRALPVDTNAPDVNATPSSATGAAPGAGGPVRTYKVVSGDSLWKIAHKMYPGDTKNGIDKIKDANKDILIEGKPLKIGQVLTIP